MRLLGLVKGHWLVLALAVLVSLIYGSHHFFISRELTGRGLEYYPVTIASNRDEGAMYGPRASAVFEGQLIAGDVSISGNEKSPSILPMLNPIILGGLGRILGSLKAAFIVSDFLFPPLIFVILYLLALELSRSKLLSSLFASVFIFMPKIFLLSDFTREILPDPANELYFSRFEYPKITYLFFASALYLILIALKRNQKYLTILAGASFGLVFYSYLYDWVHVFIGLLLMFLFFLFQKDYGRVRRLLIIISVGFLIAIFYWINFLNLRNLPHYADLVNRIGVEIGYNFRLATAWKSYARAGFLALFIWFLWKKRDKITATYLASLLLVIAVVLNIQVLLGFNPQPDHWHRTQFLAVGLGILALAEWFNKKHLDNLPRQFKALAAGILIALILGKSFYAQYLYSEQNADRYSINQVQAVSYKWLNRKAVKGSVVGSISFSVNGELLLYTASEIFLPNGFNTTISDAEIWDRFMIAARIFGISAQEFKDLARQTDNVLYLFHDEYRDRSFDSYFGTSGRVLPEEVAAEAERRYAGYLKVPADDLALRYQLDYLYFKDGDPGKDPIQILPAIKKVFDANGIRIYRLKS